jgi:hypothetical protein
VLVTGSREFRDEQLMRKAFVENVDWAYEAGEEIVIVEGCARGADEMSNRVAWLLYEDGAEIEHHPAQWAHWGNLAGHVRNQQMVDAGADICLAFFQTGAGNRGTTNCVNAARLAGIPVVEVWGR